MEDKLLFTIAEAAYKLNCSSSFVQNLIHTNKICYTMRRHNYYISNKSLDNYMKSVLFNKAPRLPKK
jgi:excisionase family DNA binding protein